VANSRSVAPPPDAPLGVVLAYLRRQRGYTGARLGRLLNWSQPKVSKIETGKTLPSPNDIERLLKALNASPEEAGRVRGLAEQLREQMTDWRVGRQDPATWQRDIARLETEATELRIFHPALLSGLLQTSENARAILTDVQRTWPEEGKPASVAAAVSARVQRQEILEDYTKEFFFVIPELVLHGLLSQGVEMTAQLERIRQVADQENVDLRIIADATGWPLPPTNGFALLDDRHVVIDLFNTVVVARSGSDLRLYRQVFDAMRAAASTDITPTLDKYRRLYLQRETGAESVG
jgi:transcriptional regulator with XRE-family HTH domain